MPEDLNEGVYELSVTGMSDSQVVINDKTTVSVAARGPTVLVQTDKPVYKAGQTGELMQIKYDCNDLIFLVFIYI